VRKRRTKYQWFTPIGVVGPAGAEGDTSAARDVLQIAGANGQTTISIIDWLPDFPGPEIIPGVQQTSMAMVQGNDYFIKRIVGKFFCSCEQSQADTIPSVWVGAGFFVARSDDNDAVGLPIGASTAALQVENYSPLRQENNNEPWLWRRTWLLGNNVGTTGLRGTDLYPRTTADYHSVADGPHIDARTARRVHSDERLYFAVATRSYPLNDLTHQAGLNMQWMLECRVLGAMRKTRGKGSF